VPLSVGTDESIVLHALLLHGGASADLLERLLPLSHSQVRQVLRQLMTAGLVEVRPDRCWQVTTLGYPAVRQFMENEGYLVDAF
jgi:predicted transcriptional regulator